MQMIYIFFCSNTKNNVFLQNGNLDEFGKLSSPKSLNFNKLNMWNPLKLMVDNMKKMVSVLMLASLFALAGCEKTPIDNPPDTTDSTDTLPSGDGLFSVSEGNQVRFALGNLTYDSVSGYAFAAHQYDYGGYFGWGTGSNPTLTSTDCDDYPSFDDWGGHIIGGWRTLSHNEWNYVIWDRPNASAKRGAATVCGVHGMVLLPDNWSGGTFRPIFDGWSTNVYDASLWSAMEDAGAVFLPAAGYRYGTEMGNIGEIGYYWSSTPFIEYDAFNMSSDDYYVYDGDYDARYLGHSVRLVQDY